MSRTPIYIKNIPSHVRFLGMSARGWLSYIDKIADKGTSDGQFTEHNFKFYKHKSMAVLNRHYAAGAWLKRFHNFEQFKKFIEQIIASQHCKNPVVKTRIASLNRNREDPNKFLCLAPPEPHLPPLPETRHRTRQPNISKFSSKFPTWFNNPKATRWMNLTQHRANPLPSYLASLRSLVAKRSNISVGTGGGNGRYGTCTYSIGASGGVGKYEEELYLPTRQEYEVKLRYEAYQIPDRFYVIEYDPKLGASRGKVVADSHFVTELKRSGLDYFDFVSMKRALKQARPNAGRLRSDTSPGTLKFQKRKGMSYKLVVDAPLVGTAWKVSVCR